MTPSSCDGRAAPEAALSGGALTVEQNELFALGHQMFYNRWAIFGRGPTSNAQACTTCHGGNGRGMTPGVPAVVKPDGERLDHNITVPFEPEPNVVIRVSFPGTDERNGPKPHPHYGDQLQTRRHQRSRQHRLGPQLKTGAFPAFPPVANQTIRPYTDLLLHDMGEGLADGRPGTSPAAATGEPRRCEGEACPRRWAMRAISCTMAVREPSRKRSAGTEASRVVRAMRLPISLAKTAKR